MSERLDQDTYLPLGTRDAVHVPIVVAKVNQRKNWHETWDKIIPGAYVKFTDNEFTKFDSCTKEEAHGIINPFLSEVSIFRPIIILLLPGITTPVRHSFNIDPSLKEKEQAALNAELESNKEQDPECADCWMIRNNRVIRV